MFRRVVLPLSIAAFLASARVVRAQDGDGDEDDAPTLIQEHGTPPADGAATPSAPAPNKPTASGAHAPSSPAGAAPAKRGPQGVAPQPPGGAKTPAPAAETSERLEVKVHDEAELGSVEQAADAAADRMAAIPAEPATMVDPDASGPEVLLERHELEEPRPPLADVEPVGRLPWQRHGEVGAALAWVSRPFDGALGDTHTRYRPAVGVALHLQWEIRPWLQVKPYFLTVTHETVVPYGALATSSPKSIRPDTVFDPIHARTFVFGGKVMPTWNLTARARAWLVAGVGYGRFGFTGVQLTEPGAKPTAVPDRDGVFVEFPMGLGGAYEVLPGRAAFVFEMTGAPVAGQSGTAHEKFQVIDNAGKLREIGPMGAISSSFVQTFGLSILL